MSVRVRLTRVGSKKNAVWRVVVADQRSPRDGRIIESLGHYNPQTQPSTIVIDRERLQHWIDQGAQPTNTVRKLMRAPDTVMVTTDPAAAPEPASTEAAPEANVAEDAPSPAELASEPAAEGDAPGTAEEPPASAEEAAEAELPESGAASSGAAAPAEGDTTPSGSADSQADAGPSGAAVESSEETETAPAGGEAAPDS